jgi:hypothetical protein
VSELMDIVRVSQNRVYTPVNDRISGDFPAKNIVYTPYIYGSGQPKILLTGADQSQADQPDSLAEGPPT